MTVTYPHDRPTAPHVIAEGDSEAAFVPVYARNRRVGRTRKGGVKTWMVLAPAAVLVLGGTAALLMASDRDDVPPAALAEPAATPPVLPAEPLLTDAAPREATQATEPVSAPAPVARRSPTPARRATSPVRSATPPSDRFSTRAEPVKPQPYTAALNTAPAPEAVQPPVIVIQPAD